MKQINQETLALALIRKKLSAIQIAHELQVHPSTLSRWFRGWNEVSDEIKPRLAQLLEVSEDKLFIEGGTNES